MAKQYTVHYFDVRGRAEPIRMILAYAGADWKDQRIPYDSPAVIPPEIKAAAKFGQVPLLEVNGEYLAQTVAIARYLAGEFKLNGSDLWDSAKCDEIADGAQDFGLLFNRAWYEQDEEKKKVIIEEAVTNGREKFISRFNSLLEANGGYFIGSEITWADIFVANVIDFNEKWWNVQIAEGFPAVQKHIQMVFNAKGIKEWIETRPDTKL